jgi:hypothetical protein
MADSMDATPRTLLSLLGGALVFLVATTDAAAPLVDKAVVNVDRERVANLLLTVRLADLSLDNVDALTFGFAGFSQTLLLADFTQRGARFTYKARGATPGIRKLILDLARQRAKVVAKRVVLPPGYSPAVVRLLAGATDECTVVELTEKPGRGGVKAVKARELPCIIDTVPSAEPAGVFVDTPTDVVIRARVRSSAPPDAGSLELFRLATLAPAGDALCPLRDDGATESGDEVAGDGIYGCIVRFAESAPGPIGLIVRSTPSFSTWSPVGRASRRRTPTCRTRWRRRASRRTTSQPSSSTSARTA